MNPRLLYLFILLTAILLTTPQVNAKSKVIFEPPRGFYLDPFELTITSPVENAMIRYTLNGTDPLTSANAKSGASPLTITVDPTTMPDRDQAPGVCVRAVAVVADTAASNMTTHTYLFIDTIGELSPHNQRPGSGWPRPGQAVNGQLMDYGMDPDVLNDSRYRDQIINAMLDVPSISMVMDLDDMFDPSYGIYVNAPEHGREWERRCSLELLNPDGSDGFHINCGVRIRGGWSRQGSNPKHAFRYFFRGEYGESKLEHPLFGDEGTDEFDKMDLRCSQNYAWAFYGDAKNTFLRDVFSRDLQRDMGQPYTRSRFYHLYINGTYWGLFQTQERSEAAYAESYFGGDRDDYDVVKVDAGYPDSEGSQPYDIEATDGTLDAYYALWEECELGFENKENYYRVLGLNPDGSVNPDYPKLVDEANLIDYNINTMFVGDFDGPISDFRGNRDPNNFYGIYNRENPQGFLHFRHDAEHSLGVQGDRGSNRTGPFPAGQQREKFNPQWLHQKLTANPEYVMHFADRVYKHFFNDGALTVKANIERWLARKQEIDLAIISESARWGDAKHSPARTRDDDWLPQVDWVVDNYFPDRSDQVLDQFIAKGWYPPFQPPAFNTRSAIVDNGFQLTMSAANGAIYYTDDGSNVYGELSGSGLQTRTLAPWTTEKRALVPTSDIGDSWRSINFDDSDWDLVSGAPGGIGYERSSGYEAYISHDVAAFMHADETNNPNPSCYVRIPFTLTTDDMAEMVQLRAQLRYDDGFAMYLNGVKVAENLAPTPLEWNSMATQNHEADAVENIDISNSINNLHVGDNVLAIHALNVSLSSSDFLVHVQLQAGYQGESSGNIISPTAKEYTGPVTINKTTQIKARLLRAGRWSALNEILLSVDEDMSGLRATELHYKPLPEGQNESELDGDLFEFFELKNISSAPINLTGASFIKGIKYDFPASTTLNPGSFYVICSSSEHFKQRYTFDAHGQYSGNLSNGGERIVLVSATGDTIINIKYSDKPPWPPEADSTGQSLVAKTTQPQGDPNDPAYWRLSAVIHGSPNADDPASPVATDTGELPRHYQLLPNYPNPFNPSTTIRFETPRDGHVSLGVYNSLGQRVELVTDEQYPAGVHRVTWDAVDYAGGVYFVRLKSGSFQQTKKILLLK